MTQYIAIQFKDKEKACTFLSFYDDEDIKLIILFLFLICCFQKIAFKLQTALSKVADVDQVVSELECEMSKLKSQFAFAEAGVHQMMKLITSAKERSEKTHECHYSDTREDV